MKYIKFLMLAVMLFSLGAHAADPPAAATYRALDDKLYVLGTDNDFQITYDSGDNRVEIRDAAGNVLGRVSDAGTTGVIGFVQHDVINGSVASQITSGATSNRAVTLPDAAGEISLLGQTIATGEIVDGTIVNADVSASAGIVPTKFSAGTDGQVVVTASSASGWGTVPSAGITDGTIVNADINASAGIAVTKLSTSGASSGYVLTYNGSAIVWAASSAVGDISAGADIDIDGLIPRMDGTGSDTLQGYNSSGVSITASDDGLLYVPGGIDVDAAIISLDNGTIALDDNSYLKYLRGAENRWEVSLTAGAESGTSGETSLQFIAYDNDGNNLRDVMKLNRTATEGVVFGSNATPSPIYVKGDIYAHTTDAQIVDDGKVLLTALAQTSATTGQVLAWDGIKYAPTSSGTGNVTNLGAGTDNSVARFNAADTAIQESQVIIDDSGNLDAAGTLTAGSANTVLTASTGIILDAALSSNVVVAGDALTGDVAATLEADGSTAATIQANSVALTTDTTGNYVGNVANGSGITGGSAGSEGAALTLALGPLTGNWDQTGAFDISLNNASSELKILESAGATYFGIFDVTDLGADRTYTFPNVSGTVVTTGDTASVTGTMITNDTVALTTDTSGNYVTSVATGTGLTGGAAASEGATLTLSLSHLGFQSLTDPNADRIAMWDDSAGAMAWLTAGTGLSISGTTITATGTGGKKRIEIPAERLHGTFIFGAPAAAAGLHSTSGREYWMVAFDASSDECAYSSFSLPSDFNASSPNVDIYIHWFNDSGGSSQDVRWGVLMAAESSGDPLNSGAATPTETVLLSTRESSADMTIASSTNQNAIAGSPAANDNVYIKVYRDANDASDNQSGDAKLVMVAIEYTPA